MLINERRKTDRRPKIPRTGKNVGLGAALAALAIVFLFAYQTQSDGSDEVDSSAIAWQPSSTISCDSVDALSGELAVSKDLVCLRVHVGDGRERLVVMASDITGLVLVLDGDDVRWGGGRADAAVMV